MGGWGALSYLCKVVSVSASVGICHLSLGTVESPVSAGQGGWEPAANWLIVPGSDSETDSRGLCLGWGVGFRLGPPPPSACPLLPPPKVADSAGLQDSISPQACCRVGAWACLMPPTFPGSPPTSPCGQGPHSPSRACGLLGPCRFTPAPTGRFLKTSWLTSTRAQCIEKRHEGTLLAWREGRGA